MSINKFILYDTECGHIVRIPVNALAGYPLSCIVCRKLSKIVKVHVNEWHAFCLMPKCRFSAWCGMSKDLAEAAANRHARSAANHSIHIQVEYMPNPVAVEHRRNLRANGILNAGTQ